MSRYVRTFPFSGSADELFNTLGQMLRSEGYDYVNYAGEDVFKKGKGLLVAPRFVKISFLPNAVQLEAWIKYALLPGVYVGEMGLTGFFGAAIKSALQRTVILLEMTIQSAASASDPNTAPAEPAAEPPVQPVSQPAAGYAPQGAPMGNPYAYQMPVIPAGQFPDKKMFFNCYAPEKLKKDIRNIAIFLYVCAGLSFVVDLVLYPLGLIDVAILFGLALGMHLGKNRGCAIALLVFSCLELLGGLVLSGTPTGVLWIIASILAVTTLNKLHREYNVFLAQWLSSQPKNENQ